MLKNLDRWIYAWWLRRRMELPAQRDVFIAVCDHFEPFHDADQALALERVRTWKAGWRKLSDEFWDSGGQRPRHTFFYPIEQWDDEVCGRLAEVCHATDAEVEIHLHHERDTAENLTVTLEKGKARCAEFGLLARDEKGELAYGFIHGNWALDDSHPEGRHCGVARELEVLSRTGCYADFTLPSAPSPCQVPTINSIYYAREGGERCSHSRGTPAKAGTIRERRRDELLLINGALGLNWKRRKWGVLPRIENSDLTEANPPTMARLRLWEKCHVHVAGRPDWIFIKLHTHGALEQNSAMLLGEPMRAFHRQLRERADADPNFRYHYVSAREMANLVHAAEAGELLNPTRHRDYRYRRNR